MYDLQNAGADWILDEVRDLTDSIEYMSPVDFVENHRYLSSATTSKPGPMRYDVNPYMREILDCFSMRSPVREVNLLKGVQLTYTVGLIESIIFYFVAYLKIYPTMLVTADAELVKTRIENNILPMLELAGFSDLIQSADEGNSKKTGKTKDLLQWEGGGFMVPIGAQNANKMRSHSILLMLKDEIDGWPLTVGRDGDPDGLTDDRTSAYTNERKILRGSTPLIKHTSKIWRNYLRGDQRKYMVVCKECGVEQFLEWRGVNDEGKEYGITFETPDGTLDEDSVRYRCKNCLHEYYNRDKAYLFDPKNGAHWKATATPSSPGIRSYHLPAYYSPIGFLSWADCVRRFLEGYDNVNKKIVDIGAYQRFVNNVKGIPFEIIGDRVRFTHVSSHRRQSYSYGQIPNRYAKEHAGSEILFLLCTVDVQKKFLSVKVTGICRDLRTFMVDYWKVEDEDCTEVTSKAWQWLSVLIEEQKYVSDNGREYGIYATFVDAGYASDTVKTFCENYDGFVFPIMGRDNIGKKTKIREFTTFETSSGKTGYFLNVDHYKERLAYVLRRTWSEDIEPQNKYHFNAPMDTTDKQLKELTVENKRQKEDGRGNVSYEWHRPSGSRNELWDLTVYAHAGAEIVAYIICRQHYQLDTIDWPTFWDFMEGMLPEADPNNIR